MNELNNYLSAIDYIRRIDQNNDQESVALEYYGNRISRRDYWRNIEKYRGYFMSLGVDKGTPIAICMINSPEYEFIFSSLLENGSIASTVSKSFLNADIMRQTTERGIKQLILSVEFLPELVKNNTFSQYNGFDSLDRIVLTTGSSFMSEEYKKEYKAPDYHSLIKELDLPKDTEIIYPEQMRSAIENICNISLPTYELMDCIATYSNTGGTTGAPKCAFHTHRAIASLIKSHDRSVFKEYNLKEKSRSLLVIPISHITSQFYALLLRRASGANIIYNPNVFDPVILREVLMEQDIDDVVLPFGLYYAMTRKPLGKGALRLNTPACGGEPTPYIPTKDVNEKLHQAGSDSIIIGTGSTEFGSGIMATYGVEGRTNESGYFFPYAKGFLLDPSDGSIISEPGKRGILYANAPWQMSGYLNDEVATKEFFNYQASDGTIYGTNNDVAEIVGEHDGKPVFSMLGRISDYVKATSAKTYFPGIKRTHGKTSKLSFDDGYFLFDMRDILLNIDGVMEAQPVIIPICKGADEGYPVVNITISPKRTPIDILKEAYRIFLESDALSPYGIVFRTRFERSLSSDKREVISLIDERKGYYYFDGSSVFTVAFPMNEKPVYELVTSDPLTVYDPPAPRGVYSNRRTNTSK